MEPTLRFHALRSITPCAHGGPTSSSVYFSAVGLLSSSLSPRAPPPLLVLLIPLASSLLLGYSSAPLPPPPLPPSPSHPCRGPPRQSLLQDSAVGHEEGCGRPRPRVRAQAGPGRTRRLLGRRRRASGVDITQNGPKFCGSEGARGSSPHGASVRCRREP